MAACWVGRAFWESSHDWRDVHCGSTLDVASAASAACHLSQASQSGAFAYQHGADYGELCRQRFILW